MDKSNPLVSIIIPVYNVALYIREALDSVIHQTYGNLEILVVDDGSTDGSGVICDEYASSDSRMIVIHQNHQGVSAARNAGLDKASGEYIAFLDPDDVYDLTFFHTMLSTIQRRECDIVVCKYEVYCTSERMKRNKRGKLFPSIEEGKYNRIEILQNLLEGKINVSIWNKLYKKRLWDSIRFPAGCNCGEDKEVSFRVFNNSHSVYVKNKPLYLYRIRRESLSHICSKERDKDVLMVHSHILMFLRSFSPEVFSEKQIKQYEISYLNQMMVYYAKCHDKTFSERLKKRIMDLSEKIGIESCGYKIRLAYNMLCRCPLLLRIIYPIYGSIRLLARKLFNR